MNYLINYFENANEIIKENQYSGALFLGNYNSSIDSEFLLKNNITVIINCTPDLPFIDEKFLKISNLNKLKSLEKYRIPVYDSLLPKDIYLMETYFDKALRFLFIKLFKEHKNVLINCYQGRQRSAIFLAAFLFVITTNRECYNIKELHNISTIQHNKYRMKAIIHFIQKTRPMTFAMGFRINFKKSLERYFNMTF